MVFKKTVNMKYFNSNTLDTCLSEPIQPIWPAFVDNQLYMK